MGKETKVGLFVIMLLLLLFGVVVVQKVRSGYNTASASQEGPETSETADLDSGTVSSTAGNDNPTIVEPQAFTREPEFGVAPVYSDVSGTPSTGSEIPSADAIGLAAGSEPSPPNQIMPNPATLSGHDAYATSTGPSLGAGLEPAQFEEPSPLDAFADPESSSSDSYRRPPMAAIGSQSQPLQGTQEPNDPFGIPEEESFDEYDGQGALQNSTPPDFDVRADDRGSVPNDNDPSSGANFFEEEPDDGPVFDAEPAVDQWDSGDARFPEVADRYEGGSSDLALPDVPPPIEDDGDPTVSAAVLMQGSAYVVKSNDSFWSISRKRYGSGRYFKALSLHNQRTVPKPEKLRPGMRVATPPRGVLERLYPESISGLASKKPGATSATGAQPSGAYRGLRGEKWYRVGNTDTLSDIAKSTLGRGSQWRVIYELNRDRIEDPDRLKPGMVLRLPETARMATRPLRPMR